MYIFTHTYRYTCTQVYVYVCVSHLVMSNYARLLCPANSPARILERLPFPSPEDLPEPGIEPRSPALQADSLPSELPGKPHIYACICTYHSDTERVTEELIKEMKIQKQILALSSIVY